MVDAVSKRRGAEAFSLRFIDVALHQIVEKSSGQNGVPINRAFVNTFDEVTEEESNPSDSDSVLQETAAVGVVDIGAAGGLLEGEAFALELNLWALEERLHLLPQVFIANAVD